VFFIPTKIEYFIPAGGGVYIYIYSIFFVCRDGGLLTRNPPKIQFMKKSKQTSNVTYFHSLKSSVGIMFLVFFLVNIVNGFTLPANLFRLLHIKLFYLRMYF
jgi:hypothetical protein